MYEYAFDYLVSWWGIVALAITSLGFGLKAYDVFAKVWPATTGKHIVKGRITWSEFVSPELVLLKQAWSRVPNEGLISYAYRVEGGQHNGVIPLEKLTQEEVDNQLYKGAEVDVYYSPRLHHYSYARKPPAQSILAGGIIANWFLMPVIVLNGLSFFIWFLANA
ncbi:MAG: hypothetical protein V7696_14880 [Halioglobus sp.]